MICIGKIVNTHGIKGEIRILSDFKYKDMIFKPSFKLYIGENHDQLTIQNYRKHKNFDMIKFVGINNINDILKYKGEYVYADRADIETSDFILTDLIGFKVYSSNRLIGECSHFLTNDFQDIMVIKKDKNKYMIPYVDSFIKSVDLKNKKIYINMIEGLIDEN